MFVAPKSASLHDPDTAGSVRQTQLRDPSRGYNRMHGDNFDALVIGGGINGLSALYHLGRLGAKRLGLLERFSIGHERGSSHGAARITRSAYTAPEYVRLMQWVHEEEWPRLEQDAGTRLVYPNPGLFAGAPCDGFNSYIRAVEKEGVDVEVMTPDEARRLYPQFTLENVERVRAEARRVGKECSSRWSPYE